MFYFSNHNLERCTEKDREKHSQKTFSRREISKRREKTDKREWNTKTTVARIDQVRRISFLNDQRLIFQHERQHLQYHRPCRKLLQVNDPIHLFKINNQSQVVHSARAQWSSLIFLTVQDHLESFDSFFEWNQFTRSTGEDFSDLKDTEKKDISMDAWIVNNDADNRPQEGSNIY